MCGGTPTLVPGAVAESVEHWPHVWEIIGLNPCRVEPMTYQIDTRRFLARCSALFGKGKDWLAQCQSWC